MPANNILCHTSIALNEPLIFNQHFSVIAFNWQKSKTMHQSSMFQPGFCRTIIDVGRYLFTYTIIMSYFSISSNHLQCVKALIFEASCTISIIILKILAEVLYKLVTYYHLVALLCYYLVYVLYFWILLLYDDVYHYLNPHNIICHATMVWKVY